jgi:hypothetical protein
MTKTVMSITKFGAVCALLPLAAACEASKSSTPLSPNVAGPIAGVSLSVPAPVSPTNGAQVVNSQPVRLVFQNTVSNGERPFWYIVELASDPGFQTKLYANGKVMPAQGAQTSVVVDGTLIAERNYFWRVKADDGANSSEFSAPASFQLVVPVTIDTPVPVSPVGGATASSTSVNLVVNNAGVTGRTGTVWYWFEVARDQGFGDKVFSDGVVRSDGSTTSVTVGLPASSQLFWRVIGTNGTVNSSWSAAQSFRTPAAAPAPGPGGGGGGGGGGGTPVGWTNDQWRDYFFVLVSQKGGATVNVGGLQAMRPDVNARGADFQYDSGGNLRPRLFLPNPGGDPYARAVDLGDWGGPWQWIVR